MDHVTVSTPTWEIICRCKLIFRVNICRSCWQRLALAIRKILLLLFFITPYTAAHKYKKAKIHLKYDLKYKKHQYKHKMTEAENL